MSLLQHCSYRLAVCSKAVGIWYTAYNSICIENIAANGLSASGADQIKYEVKKFIPFIGTSKYRGTPTAELDEAWSKLERCNCGNWQKA